jgi:hypothetical protein
MSKGTYQESASRHAPGCMIFLLDHSFSMTDPLAGSTRSKRDALALAINRFLSELLLKCQPTGEVRHYFDVAVISYTTDKAGAAVIVPALKGPLAGRELVSTVELEQQPLRIDESIKHVDDGEGGLTQIVKRVQVWYEAPPDSEMKGTPMCNAFNYVARIVQNWSSSHPHCFPPVVIHITDGQANDGPPEAVQTAADQIRAQSTNDGAALLFNCHLSELQAMGVLFPVSEAELPADPYAHLLFKISSEIPDMLRKSAEQSQIKMPPGARGMAFNADSAGMLMLIQSGTIPNRDAGAGAVAGFESGQEAGMAGFESGQDDGMGGFESGQDQGADDYGQSAEELDPKTW